jgi:hypothetical protein
MALAHSIEQSGTQRREAAQKLTALRSHQQSFTPEERILFTKLQNAMMGLETEESAEAYLKKLAKYLDAAPATALPDVMPVPANLNEAAVAANDNHASEAHAETAPIAAAPQRHFVARQRAGHFSVSEAASVAAPAIANTHEAPVAEVPTAPISETPLPQSAAAEPATESAPVPPPHLEAALKEIERPSGVEAVAKDIGLINESLNVFAHGRAFQWLRNPETGYREYMTKLIAAREAINEARKGKGGADLRAMAEELRAAAEGVRAKVGDDAAAPDHASAPEAPAAPAAPLVMPETPPAAPVSNPEPAVPETPAAAEPQATAEETPVPIRIGMDAQVPQPEPEQSPEALNVYDLPKVAPEPADVAPAENMIANAPVDPVSVSEVPAAMQEEVPSQDMHADDENSDLGFLSNTGVEDAREAIEDTASAPISPEAPAPNPEIYSPKVNEALDKLLTEWLGHTGWILHKEGLEHPDWHKMAPLTVGEVMAFAKEGKSHAGLEYATIDNLAQNLRKWGQLYGISMLQHEDTTIDEVMHRIVFESLKA